MTTKYFKCPNCGAVLVGALIWEDDEIIEYRCVCYEPDCYQATIYVNKNKLTGEYDPRTIETATLKEYEAYLQNVASRGYRI